MPYINFFGICNHLPGFLILCPLITSCFLMVLKSRKTVISIATFGVILELCFCLLSIGYLKEFRTKYYVFGGWSNIIGIEFKLNKDTIIFILLVTLAFCTSAILNSLNKETKLSIVGISGIIWTGFVGLLLTNDIFNMYVFLELSSIATCILLSLDDRNKITYKVAFDYLIVSCIAGMIFLLGVLVLYNEFGTLNIDAIGQEFGNNFGRWHNSLLAMSYVLIVMSLLIKAGLFPMHYWSMRYYINNHSHIAIILIAVASKVFLFMIFKVNNSFFGDTFQIPEVFHKVSLSFSIIGAITVIALPLIAVFANNLKVIITLSSLSQIGYLIIAIFAFNQDGVSSFINGSINHTISALGIFTIYGVMEHSTPGCNISLKSLSTYMQRYNIGGFIFSALLISLIGFMPFSLGIVSKFSLILSLYKNQSYAIVICVCIGSFFATIYMTNVLGAIMISHENENIGGVRTLGLKVISIIPQILFVICILGFIAFI